VATFVAVCDGFLRIPVNWDLWVHLFRAEFHTLAMAEMRVRRAVRPAACRFHCETRAESSTSSA
jgi:hypothetical protein